MGMKIWIKEDFNPDWFHDDRISFVFYTDMNPVNKSNRLGGSYTSYHVDLDTSEINSILNDSESEGAKKWGWNTYWIITENNIVIPTQIWPESARIEGVEEHRILYNNHAAGHDVQHGAFEGNFVDISSKDLRFMLFTKMDEFYRKKGQDSSRMERY